MNYWILLALSLTSCSSFTLRLDSAPSPISLEISETRLEFSGCGLSNEIGVLACTPDQSVSVVTEFKGDVFYFSNNPECSIRAQIRATPPLTKIDLPKVNSICPVVVYYLPEYPTSSPATLTVSGIYGEISLQPNADYIPTSGVSIAIGESFSRSYRDAVKVAYISRQFSSVQTIPGDTFTIRPFKLGTDLIQVKVWQRDGSILKQVIPANYYSPNRVGLLISSIEREEKYFYVNYPSSVSAVTINNRPQNALRVKLPIDFTGYLRAYTVKGRTLISHFEKGELKWNL